MIFRAIVVTALLAAPLAAVAAEEADDALGAGIAAFKKRNFARAEAEFGKAVDADPKSAAAHFYLGYAIYKRAEPKRPFHPDKQKAKDEFAKAFELDPSFEPDWGRGKVPAKKTETTE